MKPAILALALMYAIPACAAEVEKTMGKSDCKVVNPYQEPGTKVRWSGACQDGYAEGPGTLEWHVKGMVPTPRYEGSLQRGRMHDVNGYFRDPEGNQYEGGFVDGKHHGMGIEQRANLTRYEGNWKNGLRDGSGKVAFSLGGSYEGQWLNGRFHGAGKAVYTSGKVFEGQFVHGVPAGQPPIKYVLPERSYPLWADQTENEPRKPRSKLLGSDVPHDKPWAQLSKLEQRLIRQRYELLADEDEPPYPLHGTENILRGFYAAHRHVLEPGQMHMNVMIDSTGTPTSVTVFHSPDPILTKVVTFVVMKEKYKPALCAGTPCAMAFPFSVAFVVE